MTLGSDHLGSNPDKRTEAAGGFHADLGSLADSYGRAWVSCSRRLRDIQQVVDGWDDERDGATAAAVIARLRQIFAAEPFAADVGDHHAG